MHHHDIHVGLYKSPALNKSTKIILNYLVGIGLFFWLSYSIYHQVLHQPNLRTSITSLKGMLNSGGLGGLAAVCLLMLVNWGLEARKWQILVDPLERVSFTRSFLAILSGLSMAVVTPNRIGEYGGRILYLKNMNKLRAITVTLIGSFSQLIITILFGIGGLIYYIHHFNAAPGIILVTPGIWQKFSLILLAILTIGSVILYFRLDLIVNLISRVRLLRRIRAFVLILGRFSRTDLQKVLVLSAARYIIFSAQYLILLQLLGVGLAWWPGFWMISLIFLIMAIVPTITLAELAIRGEVGLFFLGLLSPDKLGITAATVGIWFINLILPAAIGSLLLLRVQVFSDK